MKSLRVAAAVTFGIVVLAGCGGSAQKHQSAPASAVSSMQANSSVTSPASDQPSEPGDYRVGQAVPLTDDGVAMTVRQVKLGIRDGYSKKRYLGVLVEYRNGSKTTANLGNFMYFKALDGEGQPMSPSLVISDQYPTLRSTNVTPSRTLKGWVFFEQPKSMKGVYLQFDDFTRSANVALG